MPLRNVVPTKPDGQGVATRRGRVHPRPVRRTRLPFVDAHRGSRSSSTWRSPSRTPTTRRRPARATAWRCPTRPYADKDWPNPEKGHAAMITRMDRDVGRLLGRSKQHGLDRGDARPLHLRQRPAPGGRQRPGAASTPRPVRGIKRDLYEGGIRVPLIARWPGHRRRAGLARRVFRGLHADRRARLRGRAPRAGSTGQLLPSRGQPGRRRRYEYLYWEFYEQGGAGGALRPLRRPSGSR